MNKLRTKTILIRLTLGAYRAVIQIGKYSGKFFWLLGRGLTGISRITILPVAHIIYRLTFISRLKFSRWLGPIRQTFFGALSHRHIIHLSIIIISVATGASSLGAQAVRAEDFGTNSLLYNLVSGTSDELVEENASTEPVIFRTESLVDEVALSSEPNIDFDNFSEDYLSEITGAALSAGSSSSGPSVAPRTEIVKYAVKEGDTVSSIAEEFGIGITTVLWANNLSVRSYIRPGDELIIPPLDGVIHTVKKGDTVSSLAKKYQAEEKDVLAWNKLGEGGALAVGEKLVIPGGRPPAAPVARTSPSSIFTGAKPPSASATGSGMIWPVAARRLTQYFGWRHTGLDVAGPTGTAIYAADDGIVEYSGWTRGYGNNIVINHGNGIKTRYAHSSKLYAVKGAQVTKGETIAAVGSTGRSTGPHLHFEVMVSGKFRNPLEFVR